MPVAKNDIVLTPLVVVRESRPLMNTYKAFQQADGNWRVNVHHNGALRGHTGEIVETEGEALFIAYRMARAQLLEARRLRSGDVSPACGS